MRKITIDFANCSCSKVAGYLGEKNATELKIIKPADLSGSKFLVAFMISGEVLRSKLFEADEEIKVKLWKQLTQDTTLYVQLESYDESEDYLGKSAVAKLVFQKSLNGSDAVTDTDDEDLISDITANTTMRKKLADNADVLVKFCVSDSGEILFDGKQIGNGNNSDGFSPIVNATEIEGGHRVTITDAEGKKSFDILDGKDYVLTEADKTEIAEITAGIIDTALLNAIGSGVLE